MSFDRRRLAVAFGWGVVATMVMSVPMILATASGIAPMPKPIPAAIIGLIFGPGLPKPVHLLLAAVSHLAYGSVWALIFAAVVSRITVWKGLALGVVLWLLMQLIVLPMLGWGVFGTAVTPKIAVATLVLHLIYGGTLGALMGWRDGRDQRS